ncbi:MAG TPA: hypothetical protein VGO62_18330, partial [Myxococcota bacterium]
MQFPAAAQRPPRRDRRSLAELAAIIGTFVVVVMAAGSSAGCLSDSALPSGAVVTCADNGECPRGYVCQAGRCEDEAHLPPHLTITAPARAVGDIALAATLFDPNGQQLAVSAVVVDGSDLVPVTIAPAHVKASAAGTAAPLTISGIELDGAQPRDVIVRVSVDDGTRTASADATVSYGNEAPAIDAFSAAGSGGTITLSLTVRDSSSDPVDVTSVSLQHSDGTVIADVPLDAGAFPGATLTGIATSADGSAASLTWDSADVDIAGTDAVLSITVADAFGGAATATTNLHIDNSPTVAFIGLSGVVGHALSTAPIAWLVDDPNCASGDQTVSVAFTVASGGGAFADGTLTSGTATSGLV